MSTNGRSRTADFVIIGAGVMGASIAFHLSKRKAGKIIVLEKDYVGRGASGRSSALVRMHYTFPPEVQLAVKSLQMFQNWPDITGRPGDFRRTGFVQLVPVAEIDLLKANVEMQRRNGVNVQLITADQLKEIEPDWRVEDVEAAAYEPDSGYGDGVGVATDQGEIQTSNVVVATGQWSKLLLTSIGIHFPIETEYHEVCILKNPAAMKHGGCACIDSILCVYFRSEGHDKTLVGGFTGPRGIDPDNFPQKASQESLAAIADRACKRIPALENAELVRGITGVYDVTPDYRPLLGPVPDIHGLYVVAGFSGMGFKISPAIGMVISELLLDGRATTVDITAFRPSRFAEGQPIRPEFEYAEN